MAITNLNEYYTSKGQALPSVSQRAGLASQAGISNYTGTAQQNAQLLKNLTGSTPAVDVKTSSIATPPVNIPPTIPVGVATSTVTPISLPTTQVSTVSDTLSATAKQFLSQPIVNTSADFGNATAVAQQNSELANSNYETNVEKLINNLTNRPAELAQQYNIQQLGADQQTSKAKYDAIQLEYRRQKEAETTNPALSAEQKQARLSEIGRKESSQLADIAIDYSLKAGLYTQAKTLMDEQIQHELEPLKMKVEYYKTIKNDYSNVLDKTQNAQLNNIIKQEDRAFQEKQDKLKFENDKKLAQYKSDLEINVLKQKEGLSGSSSNSELGSKMISAYAPGTTGYAMGVMLASSPNKKALTDGQITKIEKAKTALLQLQNVNELMKDVKTGPFGGRLNKALSTIGGAPNSYAVNAALTGLVPTLARGTYGEVGVLTDADVNLYKKTIPNLTSTSAQNALVQASTLKVIQGGLRSQLETLARGGYDVSLFAEDYNNFSKQILNIEDTIVDKNGNSVNAIRVSDTIKSAPQLKPLVEQMLADGKSYSDVLLALGQY